MVPPGCGQPQARALDKSLPSQPTAVRRAERQQTDPPTHLQAIRARCRGMHSPASIPASTGQQHGWAPRRADCGLSLPKSHVEGLGDH